MATMTVNTTRSSEPNSTDCDSRGFHARVDACVSECMQHAVAEGSRARVFGRPHPESLVARNLDHGGAHVETLPRVSTGRVRKIARGILTATLVLAALAAAVALQAAIHVYVWHLAG